MLFENRFSIQRLAYHPNAEPNLISNHSHVGWEPPEATCKPLPRPARYHLGISTVQGCP
jgi:hypothetical protein